MQGHNQSFHYIPRGHHFSTHRSKALIELPTSTTRDTRSRLTAQTDSTGDPAVKRGAPAKRANISNDLSNSWVKLPSLFKECYYYPARYAADSLVTWAKENIHSADRWKDMPAKPKKSSQVQAAFMNIAEALQRHIGPTIEIIDTSSQPLKTRDGGSLNPDVLFLGSGPQFPILQAESDTAKWSRCILPVIVKKKGGGIPIELAKLGTFVEEMFSMQENRRFIPALAIDEGTFRFYSFDRGGAVTGPPIDYHIKPQKLCALLEALVLNIECDVGFDPTVFYKDGRTWITIPENEGFLPLTYCVEHTLFHSRGIRGPGTVYWLVRRLAEGKDNYYLIKDSWLVGGCANERKFLENTRGAIGVAPMLDVQDLHVRGHLDSVSNNRVGVETAKLDNRVHTRAIFCAVEGAKLLDRFSNTRELLVSLRDAVYGHHNLYKSGVLHRDITPTNILIQPEAEIGYRGVLLNFSSAMETDNPSERLTGSPGSRAFYSRNSLRGSTQHTYYDDLESFFYVFCYIVSCYDSSGANKPRPAPSPINYWFEDKGNIHKTAIFAETEYSFPVHSSFKYPVTLLILNLSNFFRVRGRVRSNPEPESDYKEFLTYFDNAINSINVLEHHSTSEVQDEIKDGIVGGLEQSDWLSEDLATYSTLEGARTDGHTADRTTNTTLAVSGITNLKPWLNRWQPMTEEQANLFIQENILPFPADRRSTTDGVGTDGWSSFQVQLEHFGDGLTSNFFCLPDPCQPSMAEDSSVGSHSQSNVWPNTILFQEGSANHVGDTVQGYSDQYAGDLKRHDRPEDLPSPPSPKRNRL